MGKKALFFDIDGTLLDFETHAAPQSTIDALREAHCKGHRVFIATGRPRSLVNIPGLTDSEIVDGYVTLNGAVCLDGDIPFRRCLLAREDASAVLGLCQRRKFTCVVVDDNGMTVINPTREYREGFEAFLGIRAIPETDAEHALARELLQLTPFFGPELDEEVLAALPGCELKRWHPAFADITALGADKAAGIEAMAAHFGLDMADTVAFGDGGNDIPMLRRAAVGVAMGNAADDVKAAADMVTDPVGEDGIANALKRLGII